MRTINIKRLIGTALVTSFLAVPLTLSASVQPEGRRSFRGDRGHHGGAGRILRELDLSDEQHEQLRALREQAMSRDTLERLRERREALNEAVENGADEATIRQLAYQYGEAEGDAAVERSRMHARLMEILTPEQRDQYSALREEHKQKMEERRERMRERMENRRNREPDSF